VNCAFVSIIAVRSSLSAMVNNSFCMYYLVDFFSQILPNTIEATRLTNTPISLSNSLSDTLVNDLNDLDGG